MANALNAPQPHEPGFNAEHAQAILRELMEHGAELVRCLVEQARKDPVPHPYWGDKAPVDHPTEHIARCYDRITRSVRRSIALAKHLDTPNAPAKPGPGSPTPSRLGAGAPPHPSAERARRDAANDEPEPVEASERPDTPDWQESPADDLARPLDDVIGEIRTGFGLPAQPTYVNWEVIHPGPTDQDPYPEPDPEPDPPQNPKPNRTPRRSTIPKGGGA